MATPAPIFNPRKRPRQAMIAEPQVARGPGPSGAASYPDLMPPNFQQQQRQQQWKQQQPMQQQQQQQPRYPSSGRGTTNTSTTWGANQQTTNNQSMNRGPGHTTAAGSYGRQNYTSGNNQSRERPNEGTMEIQSRGQQQQSSSTTNSYGMATYGGSGQTGNGRPQGQQVSLPPVGRSQTTNGPAGTCSNWRMQGNQTGQATGGRYGGSQGNQTAAQGTSGRYGGPQGNQTAQATSCRYGGPQGNQTGQATGGRYGGPNTSSYGDTGKPGWNRQEATFKGNNSQAPTTNRYSSNNNNSSSSNSMRGGFQSNTSHRPPAPSHGITQSQLANTNWDDSFTQPATSKPTNNTKQTKWTQKKSPEQDKGLHVVTVSIPEVKKWNNHKVNCQMMFEMYGYLDSAISKSLTGCREFTLRDEMKNAISCVFFEIDRQIPKMMRGQWQRVIGNYDEKGCRLRCVSVRTVTQDERNMVQTLISTSSRYLTALLQRGREP